MADNFYEALEGILDDARAGEKQQKVIAALDDLYASRVTAEVERLRADLAEGARVLMVTGEKLEAARSEVAAAERVRDNALSGEATAEAERDDARRDLATTQGEIEQHLAMNVDLHAEVEERGRALADWQRVAGQHQAAMFEAKNRADHLAEQVRALARTLKGSKPYCRAHPEAAEDCDGCRDVALVRAALNDMEAGQ